MFKFDEPIPSLCDTCKHAYVMPGGTISFINGTYQQRYCSEPGGAAEVTENGHTFYRGISVNGYNTCSKYEKKEENGNPEV